MDPPVHLFIPYRIDGEAIVSPYYDTPEFRVEVESWFAPERRWRWRCLTLDEAIVAAEVETARAAGALVLNLCDGDEEDGYPGPAVVEALAAAGVPFTGADPRFYSISSSKLAMKQCFLSAGVKTAPFLPLASERDIAKVGGAVGYPCILKLDLSADGIGMTRRSVANSAEDLGRELERLRQQDQFIRGPYVERYIAGREMSVLVVEDEAAPSGLRAFAPVECVFDERIPVNERILFKGHRDYDPSGGKRVGDAPSRVDYRVAPPQLHQALQEVALAAFRSVSGVGYARIDLRLDAADGKIMALEVNANCSLSREEPSIAPALAEAAWDFSQLVTLMLRAAMRRTS